MKEVNEKTQKLTNNAVIAIDNFVNELADKNFESNKDKIDFVLLVGINLLGNLCLTNTPQNIEAMKKNSTTTVNKLSNWFDVILSGIQKQERKMSS